jgi:hypothetical protein
MLASSRHMIGRPNVSKYLQYKESIRAAGNIAINGKNSTAVVMGGFGFKHRHINKYSPLYTQFDFNVLPVISSIKQMTHPSVGMKHGKNLADQLLKINQPVVLHVISGSFLIMIWALESLNKDWRDEYVKAIVFDSAPVLRDVKCFGGWIAFMLKRDHLNPYLSHLLYPLLSSYFFSYAGNTDDRIKQDYLNTFGNTSVIPRYARILFLYGKNEPVLNYDYLQKFILDRKEHQYYDKSVTEISFERSRHALSLVDCPEEYNQYLMNLLTTVPEWSLCSNE